MTTLQGPRAMSEPDSSKAPPSGTQDAPASDHQAASDAHLGIEAEMDWRSEEQEVSCRVLILKLSGAGASVLAERSPKVGESLRLTLPRESAAPDPIEARVAETWTDPSGRRLVQIRFARWVPLGPFIAARRERRLWKRYPVREGRASLAWREGEGEGERSVDGDLLNICVGGAAFLGEILPPSGIPIWLRLAAAGEAIAPVEGRLLMTSFDPNGRWVAHIEFVAPCPPDFFNRAVGGS